MAGQAFAAAGTSACGPAPAQRLRNEAVTLRVPDRKHVPQFLLVGAELDVRCQFRKAPKLFGQIAAFFMFREARREKHKAVERAQRLQPLVVVLEDAHWLDSASWTLTAAAAAAPGRVLLVVVARPLREPLPAECRRFLANSDLERIARVLGIEVDPKKLERYRLDC